MGSAEVAGRDPGGHHSAAAQRAYSALERWCRDHGRSPAGVTWEVYGDWEEEPAKRRTDVYLLLGDERE